MAQINKQTLYQLKADRVEALKVAESALAENRMEDHEAGMAKIKEFNDQIDKVEKLLEEWERFGSQDPSAGGVPHAEQGPEVKSYDAAVKSFAAAARAGFPKTKAAGDFMSEGVDPDGGYTVPEDISTKIIQFRESKESLMDEVQVIHVTTKRGKRTIKKRGQHQGFATVAEAAKFGKTATPQFAVLEYDIKKRGGYLPVTNELLEDSDNNIAAVAVEWLGDEARVTGNKEILAVIGKKDPQDLKNLDGILAAWVKLGSAFRSTSKLITNDDGLLWLGTLKDSNGRYLLTPNPADPQQLRLCVGPHTLPVKTYDNDTIPTADGKIPMILGDLKEGVAYWDRRMFTIKVFDQATIGDFNAAAQDMTLWRGDLRDDCTLWDDGAFINGYIAAGSVAGSGEAAG
ncbi:MAG: phage major capsid protein [Bacteroides sp.]|nr:phage major capsid protein [Bacteroides sp.]MBD5356569.1 phage major capsid protein [Bacteroides sp.]